MASNGFLSADGPDGSSTPTKHRRSASVRSSRSRITLVEDDPDLALKVSNEASKAVIYSGPKYKWIDHLRGVFGLKIAKGKGHVQPFEEKFEYTPTSQEPEMDESSSPWILPVYVLSSRRDTDKHQVPKEAKCTIDTGNMQGNIVSRAFVENVLEFSEANFSKLTPEEKEGGTGITGHKLIPDGAIYLTWYHKKSTRVFRDMRFLISPNPHLDLIIGARSIQKDKLLAVPNLIDEGANTSSRIDKGRLYIKFEPDADSKRASLYNAWSDANEKVIELDRLMTEATRKQLTSTIRRLEARLIIPQNQLLICVLELEIYDWGHGKDSKNFKPADKNKKIEENYKALEKIEGYDKKESRLHKITGSKWKKD